MSGAALATRPVATVAAVGRAVERLLYGVQGRLPARGEVLALVPWDEASEALRRAAALRGMGGVHVRLVADGAAIEVAVAADLPRGGGWQAGEDVGPGSAGAGWDWEP